MRNPSHRYSYMRCTAALDNHGHASKNETECPSDSTSPLQIQPTILKARSPRGCCTRAHTSLDHDASKYDPVSTDTPVWLHTMSYSADTCLSVKDLQRHCVKQTKPNHKRTGVIWEKSPRLDSSELWGCLTQALWVRATQAALPECKLREARVVKATQRDSWMEQCRPRMTEEWEVW